MNGFDLNTNSSAKIVKGQLRQAISPAGRKILQLWRDGTLVFAVAGDRDFLCWGNYGPNNSTLRINPLVLAESTYLFSKLSVEVLKYETPKPYEIEYSIGFRNMPIDDPSSGLVPFPLGTIGWHFSENIISPSESNTELIIPIREDDINPGIVAYNLVREFYLWFGVEADLIPYKEKIDDHWEISSTLVKKGGEG